MATSTFASFPRRPMSIDPNSREPSRGLLSDGTVHRHPTRCLCTSGSDRWQAHTPCVPRATFAFHRQGTSFHSSPGSRVDSGNPLRDSIPFRQIPATIRSKIEHPQMPITTDSIYLEITEPRQFELCVLIKQDGNSRFTKPVVAPSETPLFSPFTPVKTLFVTAIG